MRRDGWFRVGVCGLLLTTSVCIAAPVSGQPAAFDSLFQSLDDGKIATLSADGTAQQLKQLQALLPPGDVKRDLRYRALHCDWGFDNDAKAQLAYAEDGLERAHRAADVEARIRFHYCRATAREQVDTPQRVLADYQAGIALSRKSENQRLLADGLSARGGMESLLGEQARAIQDMLAAQGMYQRSGFRDDAESILLSLAIAYRRMGDADMARDYLKQNEAFARKRGNWTQLIANLMQQGYLDEDHGRPDAALDSYRRALELANAQSSGYDIGSAHMAMALPYILKHQFTHALEVLSLAQAELAAVGDTSNQDMIALRRGQALAGLGRHTQALGDYNQAAALIERSGNLRYQAMLYEARAASQEALGHDAAALADLRRYIMIHESIADTERDQQTQLLRYQFDTRRRDLENQRLVREQQLRDRQVDALLKARRWQWTALGLGGVLLAVLGAMILRQLVRMRRLRELASTDALTGVANRRSIERLGSDALANARAAGQGLTVMTFDIDFFKRVNDTFGHLAGDLVLTRIARVCQDALRQFDLLGRTGGEEFMVVLPTTRLEQGRQIAERLRAAVASTEFGDIAQGLSVTISLGMAELQAGDTDLKALMHRADHALYRAKANGRDRIEIEA